MSNIVDILIFLHYTSLTTTWLGKTQMQVTLAQSQGQIEEQGQPAVQDM